MEMREKVTSSSHPQYRARLRELDREGWADFHKLTLRESLMVSVAVTCLDAMEEATNAKGDPMNKTAEQLAKEAGLKSFDYAVPMDWMMHGIKLTGLNMGIVVWSYDPRDDDSKNIFGHPVALDDEGKKFLAAYKVAEERERCFGENARCQHYTVNQCHAHIAKLEAGLEVA